MILAAWVVLSFIFPTFPAIVFLLFLGPKSTGKTEAMNILSRLTRCGHKAGITAAALGDLMRSEDRR